jgi:hypothetical protein
MGGLGNRQGLAQAGMGQNKIIVNMEQRQLMLQAVFALAQGIDPSSDGSNALTHVEIEPLYHGCIDLPATRSQHLFDGLHGAEHHPMLPPPPRAYAGTA